MTGNDNHFRFTCEYWKSVLDDFAPWRDGAWYCLWNRRPLWQYFFFFFFKASSFSSHFRTRSHVMTSVLTRSSFDTHRAASQLVRWAGIIKCSRAKIEREKTHCPPGRSLAPRWSRREVVIVRSDSLSENSFVRYDKIRARFLRMREDSSERNRHRGKEAFAGCLENSSNIVALSARYEISNTAEFTRSIEAK